MKEVVPCLGNTVAEVMNSFKALASSSEGRKVEAVLQDGMRYGFQPGGVLAVVLWEDFGGLRTATDDEANALKNEIELGQAKIYTCKDVVGSPQDVKVVHEAGFESATSSPCRPKVKM